MDSVQTKRQEAEPNWADLVDAWRAQAWERAYEDLTRLASVARRRDAEVEHRGSPQQQR
jgi:hypothetical protein